MNDVTKATGDHHQIPPNIRSFVYLVGMLGFPVIVAAYVLVVLSNDLKRVDESLSQLATRIDERPMSLEKTTDFVVYLTESLRNELKANASVYILSLPMNSPDDNKQIIVHINRIIRLIESNTRPIVRRHKRFAERFPSSGGNLASFFSLTAPGEDISANDTEGYLTGETSKDFAESLVALISNNLKTFGHPAITRADEAGQIEALSQNPLAAMFGLGGEEAADELSLRDEDTSEADLESMEHQGGSIELMSAELFLELTHGAIDTATTALRDQMLLRSRLNTVDFEREVR